MLASKLYDSVSASVIVKSFKALSDVSFHQCNENLSIRASLLSGAAAHKELCRLYNIADTY